MTSSAAGPRLRLVCVNDVYSLERMPSLKTMVARARDEVPGVPVLVTMAGDFLAPSLLSSMDHGRGMVDVMNDVGFTHVCFGNHEDDIAPDELAKRAAELHAAWLNTNVEGLTFELPTHQIVEVAGGGRAVRVGLLGVVMGDPSVYLKTPFGARRVVRANEAALAMAARLVSEGGCACVVPLTHQPFADDRALAAAGYAARIPLVVGGHEHEVHVEQIESAWVVKAGADARHALVVDLVWPAEAPGEGAPDLPAVHVRLVDVEAHPEDPSTRARVTAHMAPVRQLESATLLDLAEGEVLSSVGTRARQTSMGTMICSRIRDALRADACLLNGGGIRASREYAGRLTYGDVKAELPFDNEVVVARLPGRVVRDAVAASRARAPREAGCFLQVDDRARVEGPGHALVELAGAPLEPEREYAVAIVRELLLGLDGIEPLARFGAAHPERVPPSGSGREIKVVLVDAFSIAIWNSLGGLDAVDANRDGYADEPEVREAIARVRNEAPSPIVAGLVIKALDVDHDHRISREEAAAVERSQGG